MATGQLPGWLPLMNRVVMAMNRVGVQLGPVSVLTVPGRKSGKPRTTPVTPITVDRRRYIVAGLPQGDWARNVRAAGSGTLTAGRRSHQVTLTEVGDRAVCEKVLREFPKQARGGVSFWVKLGLVTSADPDEFAAAADQVAVFEVASLN